MDSLSRKIVHLPNTELTPEVVLHRTLEKVERIKAVTIVITWDDGSHATDWSRQHMDELCMAKDILCSDVVDTLTGRDQWTE